MRHSSIVRTHERTVSAIERASTIAAEEEELRADLARYLCVLVSGFFESSVKTLFRAYVSQHADERIQSQFSAGLKRVNTVNSDVLLDRAGQFDRDWKTAIATFIDGESKEAIDSVVTQRHAIAHGDVSDITLGDVERYFGRITRVVEFVEDLLLPADGGLDGAVEVGQAQ